MLASVPKPAHHSLIPHWLTHLGGLGLFAVAVLDSSVVPVPLPGSTDLLLLWLVSHRGNPYLLVAYATLGSLVGSYSNWASGKRGGEAALQRYGKSGWFQNLSNWVKAHPMLSVFVPALMPPPIPMSMFLIAAGALGISRKRFLLAFGAGRILRYSFVAWLALTYGRRMVRLWSGTLDKWSGELLGLFITLLVTGMVYTIWQLRKTKASDNLRADLRVGAV